MHINSYKYYKSIDKKIGNYWVDIFTGYQIRAFWMYYFLDLGKNWEL